MLIFGDNLMALKSLYEDQRGPNHYGTRNRIKLVYIDPPFATKQDFMKDREKAYRDKLFGAQFIEFLRKRLILLREVLADDGSIYVHLDLKKGHYIKTILDEVFEQHNFRNEIIWKRTTARSDSSTFNHIHDNIYFYTKSDSFVWKTRHTSYSSKYIKTNFKMDSANRLYRESPLTASEIRNGNSGKSWRGVDPNKIGKGRHWSIPNLTS
jgi:adenine specific DNA methylase Mod